MMDNSDRAVMGLAAIDAGQPDDNDIETQAGDAIANILHGVISGLGGADHMTEDFALGVARGVLDRAWMHFEGEALGDFEAGYTFKDSDPISRMLREASVNRWKPHA